jgi:hypothetical protein
MLVIPIALLLSTALPPRPPPPAGEAPEAQSVRAFVQGFYDWYAKKAAKQPALETALKARRADFSPDLVRDLNADIAAGAKAKGEIVGLDFDPFLASQDPVSRYDIVSIEKKGDTYWVGIHDPSPGNQAHPVDLFAEVAKSEGRWVFVDFNYPQDPSRGLLEILKMLRLDREKCAKDPKSCE